MVDEDKDPELNSLDERLKNARAKSEGPADVEEQVSPLGMAMRLGLELVVGVVIGLIVGRFLDDWLDMAPTWTIIFILLGFAAGIRNVIREATRMQANANEEE